MKANSLAVIALALALLPTCCGTWLVLSARSSDDMFRAYIGTGAGNFLQITCPAATILSLLFAAVGVDRRRTPFTVGALIVAALSFTYAFWWLLPAAPMRWR